MGDVGWTGQIGYGLDQGWDKEGIWGRDRDGVAVLQIKDLLGSRHPPSDPLDDFVGQKVRIGRESYFLTLKASYRLMA
jgi:hypothetical protein